MRMYTVCAGFRFPGLDAAFGIALMALITAAHLTAAEAHAISLDEAKQKGLVGETKSGYLEPVEASPDAKEIAQEINTKRAKAYRSIAEKHGTDVDEVAEVAGQEAIQRAPEGTFVKSPKGWIKK